MDASEIYSKRLNAKRGDISRKKENLFFQSQMDESKHLEEIRETENIHLDTAATNSRRGSR